MICCSNDIMQHLAESYRSRNAHHVGTDDRRIASYGPTVANHTSQDELEATQNAYDSIEAEIDQLKEEVLQLRDEAHKGGTTPKTEDDLVIKKYLSTRSRRKVAIDHESVEESAAARLQRLHESMKDDHTGTLQGRTRIQVAPSPRDFPALGLAKSSSTIPSPNYLGDQSRRPSYADAALTNMMEALDHAFSPSSAERKDSKVSDLISDDPLSGGSVRSRAQTGSTAATQESHDFNEEERSVIFMSERVDVDAPIMVSKGTPSPANSKPARQAPHFAQPTKSFARRAGETVRKDSLSESPKSPIEGSPTKSVNAKEPNFVTAKRAAQHQQKRKSLPGGWLNSPSQQSDHSHIEFSVKSGNLATKGVEDVSSPMSMASGSSADDWQVVDKPEARGKAAATRVKVKEIQSPSQLRKKTSSYMAPTNAATQRTIATLSREKTKRQAPATTASEIRMDMTQVIQHASQSSPRSTAASSDDSSVNFILDRPNIDANASPKQAVSKAHQPPQSPAQSRSPVNRSLLTTALAHNCDLRSLAKIPRSSPRTEKQARRAHTRSESRSSDSLASLPQVANTTKKRRTSHGHLLKPIFACLDAKGLLNQNSANNATIASYRQSVASENDSNASHAARGNRSVTPSRQAESRSDISSMDGVKEQRWKFLPPHLRRSREASIASTCTDATLCPDPVAIATQDPGQGVFGTSIPLQDAPVGVTGLSAMQLDNDFMTKRSPSSSLRATAKEFKPISNSTQEMAAQEMAAFDWQSAMQYKSDDEWSRMSQESKYAVYALRELQRGHRWSSSSTMPLKRSPPGAVFETPDHALVSNLLGPAFGPNSNGNSVNNTGSPNAPRIGQVLKPMFSPGQNNVQQLSLQGLDGNETPIKFGTAAPPVAAVYFPSTPTVSSTSDITSPPSLRRWQIGSAFSPNPYRWTGGDGKEIRFVGYGPYAERDPKSVVSFNFQGRTSSFNAAQVPNGFVDGGKENIPSPEDGIAPRSQRQWAEKLGYPKVPCGNVEITHAVEQIPFGSQLAGYCHDCMAN